MSALAMGGTGFLSSEGNLVPRLVQSVVTSYAAGEYEAAAGAYTVVMRVFSLLSSRVAVKSILRALGLPGGFPRLPRMFVADEAELREPLAALHALAIPELIALGTDPGENER
jgi:4-hydroxy-tetrahydrodipicolinate synthase